MFYPIFYKLCAKNHLDVPRKQTHIRFFEILVNHCYKVTRIFKFSVSFRVRYGFILTRLRMLLLLYMFTCFTWTHLNTHSLGRYTQKYWITCIMPLKDCCTYTGTAVPMYCTVPHNIKIQTFVFKLFFLAPWHLLTNWLWSEDAVAFLGS